MIEYLWLLYPVIGFVLAFFQPNRMVVDFVALPIIWPLVVLFHVLRMEV